MFLTEETSTASNKVVVVHTEVVFPNSGRKSISELLFTKFHVRPMTS